MDGLHLTKLEPGLDLPPDSAELAAELQKLEDWFCIPIPFYHFVIMGPWVTYYIKLVRGTPAKYAEPRLFVFAIIPLPTLSC